MSVPSHSQIGIGAIVSIILKVDQATGHQVQGKVADVLTHGDHPRGVKVRLTDGLIGRVQQVVSAAPPHASQEQFTPPQNPGNWQSHTHYPGPHTSGPSPTPRNVPDPQNWQSHTHFPSGQAAAPSLSQHPAFRSSEIRSDSTDALNLAPGERSEQVEHLQSYESSKPESEDDKNQAILQKEFPNIDSSLIAAIYGDSKDLSNTRELLQELRE